MIRWVPYPFLRITLAFCLGILWTLVFPDTSFNLLEVVGIIGLVGLLTAALGYRKWEVMGFLGGLSATLAIVTTGSLYTQLRTEAQRPNHLTGLENPTGVYVATVISSEEEREKSFRYRITIEEAQTDLGWEITQGKALLYQRKDSLYQTLEYGDQILIRGELHALPRQTNPGAFDFRRYMALQGIHHQAFASGGMIRKFAYQPPNRVKAWSLGLRNAFQRQLALAIPTERELAIVWALVLGAKDGLDSETQQAYATAGAMHVLAVSGLHVGILYGLILFAFSRLLRYRWGRYSFTFVALLALWAFAFLTGLSPSVLRACTMFSFLTLAKASHRKIHTFNSLAASAFLLLLLDPYLLTSVGFQLSYVAVAGIVYIQPRIYRWVAFQSRWLDKAWQLTTVSLAAQVATAPIAIYYFHTFPTYFVLSNFLVIPLAAVILGTGTVILVLSYAWPLGAIGLGKVLGQIVWLMNEGIFILERLPFSRTENLVLSGLEVVLLLLALLAFCAFWELRRLMYLVHCTTLVAVFAVSQWIQAQHWHNQKGFAVYDTRGFAAISVFQGTQRQFLGCNPDGMPRQAYTFSIAPHERQMGMQPGNLPPKADNHLIQLTTNSAWQAWNWQGKTFLHLHTPVRFETQTPNTTRPDFLLISHNAIKNYSEIPPTLQPKFLILDSSNKSYIAARIKAEAEQAGIPCHAVPLQGALVENL